MDDLSAIRRLKRGDIKALGVLVERYQLEAVRAACLITRDAALAEDVMQEAFLRVHRFIQQFDESRPFAPWFHRIVVHAAVQAARRQSRHVSLPDETEQAEAGSAGDLRDWLEALPDPSPLPEESATAAETRQLIWQALDQLAPEQRAVIVMRYYYDYSEQEMATVMQVQTGTISWRLHAARKRLGGLLHPLRPPAPPVPDPAPVAAKPRQEG